MPEILSESETERETKQESIAFIAQEAEKELNDILLGNNFSTRNISALRNKILGTINNQEDRPDQPTIEDALTELVPHGKNAKTFDVEAQTIADIIGDLMKNPNDFRQKNASKVDALIAFCQRFNKEQ